MKSHVIFFVTFLSFFNSVYSHSQENISRGLYFHSFEFDQDKRTGLNVTPDKRLNLPNGFKLVFDMKLRQNSNDYGYVFRLIGNDSVNIDLIAHSTTHDYLSGYAFTLVSGANSIIKVKKSDIERIKFQFWFRVVLEYNPKRKVLQLSIDDFTKAVRFETSKLSTFDLCYGYNDNPKFATTDVPPMSVKNIQVFGEHNDLKRFWKLEKHAGNHSYDELTNEKAVAVNPIWEIDKHAKWQLKSQFSIPFALPQIAFNKDNGVIYIVKHNTIYLYNALTQQVDTIYSVKGEPYNCSSNQLVYDSRTGMLISYSFDNSNLARFNFKTRTWSNEKTDKINPQFWHHCKYFNVNDSTLLTFGGYGYHKYKSDVMRYSFQSKEWNQTDIASSVTPRYLSSLGYLGNDELLYFGGYGSKTGNQVEYPHNNYDLYKINCKTLKVKKLWEMDAPHEHFTNSNSMVVNNKKRTFYNLAYSNIRYSTHIKLLEFQIDKPEYKVVGDSIPYGFKDIESYCDLLYSPLTAEMLAITSVTKNNKTEIKIYSIGYPALTIADVAQVEETTSNWYWYLIFSLLITLPILFLIKRQKDKKDRLKQKVNAYLNFEYNQLKTDLKPSSINMLGFFQLIDKDGVNITGNFTATTSQMLVLILLYTIKNGQGISTQELTEILWPDKDTDSARNNRNVYMSKLRLLIKNVGDIELANQNNYWSARIGSDVFCDYKNVMLLISQLKKQSEFSLELVNELVNVASRGVLLPNLQEEWVDTFKGDYTNIIIETLTTLLQNKEVQMDKILILRISDAILKHDNIDEDIVKLKVTTLYSLGKKSQAKQCFDKFTDDYKNFMGVAYKETFEVFREKNL